MILKLSSTPHGKEMVKTKVLAGWAEDQLTLSGTLFLDVGQWQEFGAALGLGANMLNDNMEIMLVLFEGDEEVINAQS